MLRCWPLFPGLKLASRNQSSLDDPALPSPTYSLHLHLHFFPLLTFLLHRCCYLRFKPPCCFHKLNDSPDSCCVWFPPFLTSVNLLPRPSLHPAAPSAWCIDKSPLRSPNASCSARLTLAHCGHWNRNCRTDPSSAPLASGSVCPVYPRHVAVQA